MGMAKVAKLYQFLFRESAAWSVRIKNHHSLQKANQPTKKIKKSEEKKYSQSVKILLKREFFFLHEIEPDICSATRW
jgi:hypothetical protein